MDIYNVPFGNSVYQIQNFTAGKETPERRYRNCLLQIDQKQRALKECEFRRKRLDIDIAEIKEKMLGAEKFEKQRLEIDLEEKQFGLDYEIKLIEDCIIEIAAYKAILKDLPEFTREDFEQAEQEYWEKRLLNDARREVTSTGTVSPQTIESLENIGFNIGRNKEGQIIYARKNKDDILHVSSTNKVRSLFKKH